MILAKYKNSIVYLPLSEILTILQINHNEDLIVEKFSAQSLSELKLQTQLISEI